VENTTNKIIEGIKMQNSKMAAMLGSEAALEIKLGALMKDEVDITSKLAHIAKSMELLSDTGLVFNSFLASISQIPSMIESISRSVDSIISQDITGLEISDNVLEPMLGAYFAQSIRGGSIRADWKNGIGHMYVTLPQFGRPFRKLHVRTLPIKSGTTDVWYRLVLNDDTFAYDGIDSYISTGSVGCRTYTDITICDPHVVDIRRKPQSCSENLVGQP
jgi:hypothetical protein